MSLYLINIQPNSKYHFPLPKFSGFALECGLEFVFNPPPFEICWVRPWPERIVFVNSLSAFKFKLKKFELHSIVSLIF